MRPTPDYSCWYKHNNFVYEPSEDTFIFLDGIECEIDSNTLCPGAALEIGCGSGLISVSFSKWLKCPVVSIDVNTVATSCTLEMSNANMTVVDVIVDDSGQSFRDGMFDYILINPPYVVTSSEELLASQNNKDLSTSWSGGIEGTELLYSTLLPSAARLRSHNGVIYLIAIRENQVKKIKRYLRDQFSLNCTVVISRKAGREYLYLLKIS